MDKIDGGRSIENNVSNIEVIEEFIQIHIMFKSSLVALLGQDFLNHVELPDSTKLQATGACKEN